MYILPISDLGLITGACIFVRNTVKKPEKPKVDVFEPKTSAFGFSGFHAIDLEFCFFVFLRPRLLAFRAFEPRTSTSGFSGFLTVFLTKIHAPVILSCHSKQFVYDWGILTE